MIRSVLTELSFNAAIRGCWRNGSCTIQSELRVSFGLSAASRSAAATNATRKPPRVSRLGLTTNSSAEDCRANVKPAARSTER